jgi:hypothetical protein
VVYFGKMFKDTFSIFKYNIMIIEYDTAFTH